ncbi:hypothetical protein [Fusibacter ferrireducens]|uniref:Uncharacterized protein n=1 Tax=Fusibacter ferrireducens TaxID=2785058 RepID=A0ABS0A224_9FIRM|nr:hypothetical protein [Fusibacter ferrireducens]MBF4695899.1 hypothetical protein [Fusibacter ferrireducens]
MAKKTIEDLLITLSYLRLVIIVTTTIIMLLITINGSDTKTLLSQYKIGYLAQNFKDLKGSPSIVSFLSSIWRYFVEFLLGSLGLICLLKQQFVIYFLLLLVSIAFSFSLQAEIAIIIGMEIALQMVYSVKCKYS